MATVTKNRQTIGTYTSSVSRDNGNNGETLPLDTLVLIDLSNADVLMDLPSVVGLPIGSTVHLFVLGADTINRVIISVEGTESEQLIGQGTFADQGTIAISGFNDYVTIQYQEDAGLGGKLWDVVNHDKDLADADKWLVRVATREPIPNAVQAGSLHTETLTGNVNGPLVVDGITFEGIPSQVPVGGVLIKNEVGAGRQYHGLWHVLDGGSASTKWVMRRRVDFLYAAAGQAGGEVFVELGFTNAGKTFAIPAGEQPGDAFDWIPVRAVGSWDLSDDQKASTTGAVTSVIASYSTLPNDTLSKLKVSITAQDDASNDVQTYEYLVTITRDSGGSITVDQVTEVDFFEAQSPVTAAVTFIVNSDDIDITVLGIVGRTIEWRCHYESMFLTLGGG